MSETNGRKKKALREAEVEMAETQARNWAAYSRSVTCSLRHEVTHAIVQAAVWKKKVKILRRSVTAGE